MMKTNKRVCLIKWSIIIMALLIIVNDGYWLLDIGLITTDDMEVLNMDYPIRRAAWSITDVCFVEFWVSIISVVLCIIMLANSSYEQGLVTGIIVCLSKLCLSVFYLIKGLVINQSLQNSTSNLLIESIAIKTVVSFSLSVVLIVLLRMLVKSPDTID